MITTTITINAINPGANVAGPGGRPSNDDVVDAVDDDGDDDVVDEAVVPGGDGAGGVGQVTGREAT